ncbi:hypothetical protein V6N13_054384 [Hibiscus sabdariffa]
MASAAHSQAMNQFAAAQMQPISSGPLSAASSGDVESNRLKARKFYGNKKEIQLRASVSVHFQQIIDLESPGGDDEAEDMAKDATLSIDEEIADDEVYSPRLTPVFSMIADPRGR